MTSALARITSVVAVLGLTGQSLAQTPLGFSPATNNSIPISFTRAFIRAGSAIPLSQTAGSPSIQFPDSNSSHVVLMVDLDAPGGPTNNSFSPLVHWLTSVPAGTTELGLNATVDAIAPYAGPAPPPGSGPHRYVVLALESSRPEFELPPGFEDFDGSTIEGRLMFDVSGFVESGGFQVIGGNWFTVESATNGTQPTPESGASTRSVYTSGLLGVVCLATAVASLM